MKLNLPGGKWLILVCCIATATFTSQAQEQPSPSTAVSGQTQGSRDTGTEGVKPAVVPEQTPSAGAPVDSHAYKVGPADILNVRVWHETEFSGPVAVHGDGKITLPLVGDLQAGGLTPAEIEANIKTALAKYVVNPLVTVTVQEVLSKKYYMDGEIVKPGEYPLVGPITVLEALSKAGGTREFANEKKMYILRGDKQLPFNYKDVKKGKHMEQNIVLQAGDHVIAH
jgi:polysaccharide biosynthesis/export protein